MKASKKILSLLLVLAVIMAFGATAFADASNPTITIDNAEKGVVYELYRIFDATYSGSGANVTVAYTINSNWEAFFAAGAPGAAYLATSNMNGVLKNTIEQGGSIKYINITEANKAAFAKDAADWAIANANPVATQQLAAAATTSTISFTGLNLGYYMIFPRGASYGNQYSTTDTSGNVTIITLDTTVPDAAVHAKAGVKPGDPPTPPIDKTAQDASGNQVKILNGEVGQIVHFTIPGEVPHTEGYAKYIYEVTDTMTPGLTFTDADFRAMSITFGTETVSFGNANTIADGNANGMAKATREKTSTGFKLTFDMTEYQTQAGKAITITYNAVVNEQAVAALTTNTAELRYSNNPRQADITVPATPDPPPVVYIVVNKLVIDKYDGSDSTKATKLNGAKFVLKKVENNVTKYYKLTAAATATAPAKVEWVNDKTQATVATTGGMDTSNRPLGAAEFIGLANGTYILEETEAPTGYNKASDITVEVNAGATATVGIAKTQEIANNTGAELPTTGGIGTTIFYVLGSCLLLGAAVLMITRKRMGREG